MINKKTAMVNWINVAFSFIALVLECMPKSVIKAIRTGHGYLTSYHSYFANTKEWNIGLFFAFIFAILTILSLIFNMILLLKRNKAIYITSIVLSSLCAIISIFMLFTRFTTAYNVVIMALFLIQTSVKFAVIFYRDKGDEKRRKLLNLMSLSVLVAIMVLELIPDSMQIVTKYLFNGLSGIGGSGFSYLFYAGDNWLNLLALFVAIITICSLAISFVMLSIDSRGLAITQLAMLSVCFILNIAICIMAGSQVTVSNILISILFVAPVIAQSIKLKYNYKNNVKLDAAVVENE